MTDSKANNEAANQLKKMTETSVKKLVIRLAVPTIISMMITAIYNTADTYFVSKLGTSAAAAVGVVFSLMTILQAFGFTMGMGAGSNISRFLGAGKNEEADIYASSAVFSSLFIGIIIAVPGLIFLEPLMTALGSTGTMLEYSAEYGKFILISAPFMLLTFVFNNILRSCGKAKFSMIGIMSGSILNLILDPLFIFVLDMGITGAGLATAIGQMVSSGILALMFVFGKAPVKLDIKNMSSEISVYGKIIKNGLPSFCRQGLSGLSSVLINTATSNYGDYAIASLSIVTKIFMMIFSVILGIGQGYQPVVGYNYGAKKYERVYEAMKFTFVVKFIIMFILSALGFIFSKQLITLFINDDPNVIETGSLALKIQCLSMPLIPLSTISNMTFQSIGKAWESTILSCCRQGIFYIPAVFILPQLFGLNGVISVQFVSDIFSSAVCIPFLVVFIKNLKKQILEENI